MPFQYETIVLEKSADISVLARKKLMVATALINKPDILLLDEPVGGLTPKEIDEFITYELPNNLLGIIWKGKFRGQKQKWFIFRFEGDETEINVKTQKPEFLEWKWINLEDITKVVVKFKLNVYTKIQQHVKDLLSKQRN